MLTLKFKRLSETAQIPTKAHDRDACYDLYADLPFLKQGESINSCGHNARS